MPPKRKFPLTPEEISTRKAKKAKDSRDRRRKIREDGAKNGKLEEVLEKEQRLARKRRAEEAAKTGVVDEQTLRNRAHRRLKWQEMKDTDDPLYKSRMENIKLNAQKKRIEEMERGEGETVKERNKKLRQKKAEERKKNPLLFIKEKLSLPKSIKHAVERSLMTPTEVQYTRSLTIQSPDKPWKKQRPGRPANYESLEPELTEEWCFKELLVNEMKCRFNALRMNTCVEALELQLGPDIPDPEPTKHSDTLSKEIKCLDSWKLSKRWDVMHSIANPNLVERMDIPTVDPLQNSAESHNRWDRIAERDGGVAENNEIVDACNSIQIKIEREEEEEESGEQQESTEDARNEKEVREWIARVIAEDVEEDVQMVSRKITSFTDKSQENINKITFQPPSNQDRRLTNYYWRGRGIQRMLEEKMEKVEEKFKAARNRWIAEKPDETEIRNKVDAERTKLREEVIKEKLGLIELARQELIRNRSILSKETLEERNQRIQSSYEQERDRLIKRVNKTSTMTHEQHKAFNAERARIRLKREKSEYNLYIALAEVTSSTLEKEISPEDILKFENIILQEDHRKAIRFFGDYFSVKIDSHLKPYRKLLKDLLSARVRVKEVESDQPPPLRPSLDPVILEELIPASESQSRKDFEEVRTFIAKYGEGVKKHVTFKRFYISSYAKKKAEEMTPEQKEKRRIKYNAHFRKMYHKRKFGLDTKLGDYLKTRDPTKRNNKLDQSSRRKSSQKETPTPQAPALPKTRKRTSAYAPRKKPPKKRKSVVVEDSDSQESLQEGPTSTNSNSTFNELSNSGDGLTDCGADDGSNEMWTPSGSVGIDLVEVNSSVTSVIPQELINLANGVSPYYQHNQQLNVQNQYETLGFQQLHPHMTQTYSYQMPQLQLITPQTNVNQNSQQWPCYPQITSSVPYLQNNQLDMLAHVSSNQQMPQLWNTVPSSSTATQSSIPETFQQTQTQINVTSEHGDNAGYSSSSSSSSQSLPSPPKKKRGRPKGFKVTRSKNRNFTLSQNSVQKAKDIWNNRQRRKYYERFGRPEKDKTPKLSTAVASIVSSTTHDDFESLRENLNATFALNQEHLLSKCSHCEKMCNGEEDLQKHVKKFHIDELNETPEDTEEQTSKEKRPKSTKRFECKECFSDQGNALRLIQHIFLLHFETKRHLCPFSFKKKCTSIKFHREGLNLHIRKVHPKEIDISFIMGITPREKTATSKHFYCLYCEGDSYTAFDSYSKLHNHYKSTHDKIRYACIYCGIYLRQDDFWADHIKLFHPEKKHQGPPHPLEVDENDMCRCKTCHSDFSSQSFLEEHINQGHTWLNKNYDSKHEKIVCIKCATEFGAVYTRDQHSKVCNSPSQVCYWCKKKFESEEFLKKHLSELHPLEAQIPENFEEDYTHAPYKCEICRRSYMSLYKVRNHAISDHQLIEFLEKMKEEGHVMQSIEEKSLSQSQNTDLKPTSSFSADKTLQKSATKPPAETNDELKKLYTCPKCPFQATAKDFHYIHKSRDNVMKKYCVECDRVFSRIIVLHQHREAAHGLLKDTWKNPPKCGKGGLIPHGVKPEEWHSCQVCSLGFSSDEVHENHLWSEKDSEARNCPHCSEKFYSSLNYHNHQHVVHQVPLNMKMSIRKTEAEKEASNTAEKLEKRPNRDYSIKPLTPEDYDKLIAESTVKSTKSSTREMQLFTCLVCLNKSFNTYEFIRKHIEDNHKEDAFTRVACKKCCCTFSNIRSLQKHESINHKKKLTRFKCPFCETTFMRKDHLRDHAKSKHGGQLFTHNDIEVVPVTEEMGLHICKICSRIVKTKESLKTHMTTSHFPIHFSTFCEFCGLQCNPKYLNHHVQTYHSEVATCEKRALKKRLNLMETAELVKGVYDQAGINYNIKIRRSETHKSSRKSKRKKSPNKTARKRAPRNRKKKDSSEEEEDFDLESNGSSGSEENADNFSLHSSSEDEDDLFFSEIDNESDEDGVSLKDVLIKPQKTKKEILAPTTKSTRKQPTRISVKSSIYAENDEDEEVDNNNAEEYIAPEVEGIENENLKPQQSQPEDTLTIAPLIMPVATEKKETQSTPSIEKSKRLVIVLEPCDRKLIKMNMARISKEIVNTEKNAPNSSRKSTRKLSKSSPRPKSKKPSPKKTYSPKSLQNNSDNLCIQQKSNNPRTYTNKKSQQNPAPIEEDLPQEIIIKDEIQDMIFDELENSESSMSPSDEPEINCQYVPANERQDIESEIDTFVLHNYGF